MIVPLCFLSKIIKCSKMKEMVHVVFVNRPFLWSEFCQRSRGQRNSWKILNESPIHIASPVRIPNRGDTISTIHNLNRCRWFGTELSFVDRNPQMITRCQTTDIYRESPFWNNINVSQQAPIEVARTKTICSRWGSNSQPRTSSTIPDYKIRALADCATGASYVMGKI